MRIAIDITTHSSHFAIASACETICNGLAECAADPHAHGSYCKSDHKPQVCFGLYYDDEARTSMHLNPNNNFADKISRSWALLLYLLVRSAARLFEACREDPHAHGSYCKDANVPRTCFGLLFRDATETSMCF